MSTMLKISLFLVLFLFDRHVLAISGGEEAADGEFPFMVSIRDNTNCHICGGTIIGNQWIMTSSICYSLSWFGYVQYGSNILSNDCGEVDPSNEIKMAEALYNPWATDLAPYVHDMVLIRLNGTIPFSDTAKPVELPVLDEAWPYNKTGTIVGWGGDEWFANELTLHKAEVPLYSDEYCINPKLWDGWIISDPFVMKCGGEINTTYYCRQDYGGPLLFEGKQFGIMSYIFSSGTRTCGGYLGIYSPVSYFRNWILETTGI